MLLKIFVEKNKKSFILKFFSIVLLTLSFWSIQVSSAKSCTLDSECDDLNTCTVDICDVALGICSNTILTNFTSCDDGDLCTLGDICFGGICSGSPKNCNDFNVCTDDTCDSTTGACLYPAVTIFTSCDDGDLCTLGDTCSLGLCVPGPPKNCNDDNACTDDLACIPATGICPYVLDAHVGENCSTDNYCVFNEKCTNIGTCAGTVRSCDDNNLCTDDSCSNALSSCVNANNANPCDDGNLCTNEIGAPLVHNGCNGQDDRCIGGVCIGVPISCDNSCENPTTCTGGTPCTRNYNGSCDPVDGCCKNYSTDDCTAIGNVGYCRDNLCDPAICKHPLTTATCNLIPIPPLLNIGQGSVLNWTTGCGKADTGSLFDSNGNTLGENLPLSGSISIFPLVNTLYSMTLGNYHDVSEFHPFPEGAYLPGLPGVCNRNVDFFLPTCTLTANELSVVKGNRATLNWTATNALSGTISGGGLSGVVTEPILSGAIDTPPINVSTTFTMTPVGPGGAGNCSITISVLGPPTGGLVPCARLADNSATTDIDESQPCTICAMFYMLKNIINFIITLAIGIGVFVLVVAGLLYALSVGNPRNIELARLATGNVIAGIVIIFIAWVAIAVILQVMGYANMSVWNQVNCTLPT